MGLQNDVLTTIQTRGAMSNAEVREALKLDSDQCMRVSGALKDLVRHGYLKVLPRDAVTHQRYEALPVPAKRPNANTETARSLRSAAIRLLIDAGDCTMHGAKHEKLLSLIARAESISTPPLTVVALPRGARQ